jgi:type I restriction enzyme S subunit
MAGDWRDVALEDVADELTVGYVGPMASEYVDEGIPFLRSLNVDPLRINKNDLKFITPEFHSRIRKSRLTPGDVVIVRTGKPGSCSVVPEWLADANCSDLVIVRCGPQLDNRFLAYYVNTVAGDHVAAHLVGAVQQHFNVGAARTLRIKLPPLAEQKAIAAVLGALDDRIEMNRRMNATLEAMARALFQSWFVDFDPVRAKVDGRQPFGLDSDTAALFPANFEESALGPIPQGWEAGRLDDVLTLQRGFDLPTPDRTHGKYPVMAASGPNGCHDKFMVRGPGVTTGRSGVLGRVFFIHGDFWPLNTSLWVKEFKRVSTAYSFHLLRGLDFEMFNAGSAVPTLNRNHVHNLPVVIPPKPIIEAFDSLVMPLMKRQKANEDQSHILATLRDTMLPKLLSGELQINE